jgi:hypothetical protein
MRMAWTRWGGWAGCALALVLGLAVPAAAASILFVGNSFTQGEFSDVKHYRPDLVTDLNGDGIGGVPALFKMFVTEAGLDYQVSLETVPAVGLDYHLDHEAAALDRPWDVVVLQTISMLDVYAPGNPAVLVRTTPRIAYILRAKNPAVEIHLDATWSNARAPYVAKSGWYGKPIGQMAKDVYSGCLLAADAAHLASVIPVGLAWNRAIDSGLAEDDPDDIFNFSGMDLWAMDDHHASAQGYYLEALVIFGRVTGMDPLSLGARETAAADLDIAPGDALALQKVAHDELLADDQQIRQTHG